MANKDKKKQPAKQEVQATPPESEAKVEGEEIPAPEPQPEGPKVTSSDVVRERVLRKALKAKNPWIVVVFYALEITRETLQEAVTRPK